MAHYTYEGLHFELPDGLSNDEAISKIETHLGKKPKAGAIPGQEGEAARVAALNTARKPLTPRDKITAGLETAMNLGSGLVSGVAAPVIAGVKRAVGTVPDWEKETARLVEEGTYQPRSEFGQDTAALAGKFMNDVLAPLGAGNLTGLAQSRPIGRIPKLDEPVKAPDNFRAAVDNQVAPEVKQGFDPYVKKAAEKAADDATVARLEAAIAKQNPEQPPMAVTPEGQAFKLDPGVEAGRAAAEQLQREIAQIKAVLEQNNRSIQEGLQPLLDAKKYDEVQKALRERQLALEQEVAKQTSLEQNARMRRMQEEASTGLEADQARLRSLAEQRLPGDNSPMKFESPYPVDTQQFPQVLKEEPFQYDNGIPYDQPMQDAALPLEVRDALGTVSESDPFNRYSPNQAARRILIEGEKPAIIKSQPGGLRRRQGGGIDPDLLTLGIPKAAKYLKDKYGEGIAQTLESVASKFGREKEPVAAYLSKLPGLSKQADRFITKPKSSGDLLEQAKAQGDGPDLATNWQSGLSLAAQKGDSVMLKNMAQWFNWANTRANYLIREAIVPLETRLTHLGKDLSNLHYVMQKEMFQRSQFTPEQLLQMGMSQKGVDAYQALRKTFDMFFNEQNAAREKLGKSPMTKQEAYMASVFRGDYHLPVYDKNGGLRFYIQTTTRKQTKAAIAWLQKEFKDNPNFDFSKLRYDHNKMYNPGGKFGDLPRDVMSSWKDIVEAMGDDPLAAEIKQAMERWVDQKGAQAFKQDLHQVDKKHNIRGFEGDQPWLSADDNAHNWAKAQVDYLKQAARWSATQEAISNAKTFLTDPDILQNQPNNVTLAKAYMYNHMGLTANLAKNLESAFAGSMGLSRDVINSISSVMRAGLYIKTLTFSPGYMIATPIQAIWNSTGRYALEAAEGNVKTDTSQFLRSVFDAVADERVGTKATSFNAEALKWAEDNGVISNIVYEDDRSLGSHPIAAKAQKFADWSIAMPDRFARRTVFLPFANSLWDSGKFATKEDAFRKAGEITNDVAVSLAPQDRPLIVQKLGQLGTMGYVFHSPILNMYNNLSMLGRYGKRTGNYKPLLIALGMMTAVGGIWNIPGASELEKMFDGLKGFVAERMPNQYHKIKDINPRLAVLQSLPEMNVLGNTGGDVISYGIASTVLGTDMRGRFSNEVINAEDPLGSALPITSVYGDMIGSAAKAAMNPNAFTGTQLAKDLAPGGLARGLIETTSDRFKAPVQPYKDQGITSFRKPSDISDPTLHVNRDEGEIWARRFGVTALSEAKRREKDALADKEKARLTTARKGVFDSMFKAIVNKTGDERTIADAVQKYYALDGNPQDIQNQLERKFQDLPFTRQQLQVMKAKRYEQIMNVVRRMEMDQK